MPIYLDNEGAIEVLGLVDANGQAVTNASVTAYLLRRGASEEEVWTGSVPHVSGGNYSTVVPDTIEVTEGEILVERVEIESGALNAVYENARRVRRRLS